MDDDDVLADLGEQVGRNSSARRDPGRRWVHIDDHQPRVADEDRDAETLYACHQLPPSCGGRYRLTRAAAGHRPVQLRSLQLATPEHGDVIHSEGGNLGFIPQPPGQAP